MKKAIMLLFCLPFFGACSDKKVEIDNVPQSQEVMCISEIKEDPMTVEEITEYVDMNREIFGNVLIFENWDEVDMVLDEVESNSYQYLESWMLERNYDSRIMRSLIGYDKVLNDLDEEFGEDIMEDIPDNLEDGIEASFYRLLEEYQMSELLYIHQIEDPDYGVLECIEPFGLGVDPYSLFYNNSGIFIVEGLVYKPVGDYMIIAPVDKYDGVALYNNMEQLEIACAAGEIDSDVIVYNCLISGVKSVMDYEASNRRYKMTLKLYTRDVMGWFHLRRKGGIVIKNYKKNKKGTYCWLNRSCIEYDISFFSDCNEEKLPIYTFRFADAKRKSIIRKSGSCLVGGSFFDFRPYIVEPDGYVSNGRGLYIDIN